MYWLFAALPPYIDYIVAEPVGNLVILSNVYDDLLLSTFKMFETGLVPNNGYYTVSNKKSEGT